MTVWQLEPRDTLVLRDGRPMRGDGLQMKSLPLPYPSATAGFFRTRSATDEAGRFVHAGDKPACAELLKIDVRGPWLVELDGDDATPLLPAPRDALQLEVKDDEGTLRIVRLGRLVSLSAGEQTDLTGELALIGPAARIADKPARQSVALWRWEHVENWLTDPINSSARRAELGWSHPALEPRTNVKIDAKTRTGEDGQLFTVEHRRYQGSPGTPTTRKRLSSARRLALAVQCDAAGVRPGMVPFAGERRLVRLRESTSGIPAVPSKIRARVIADRAARVMLITPAHFDAGWRPHWLLAQREGVKVALRAAVVPRPEVVSGWDMAAGRPKPTRRLAPAGSVYFVRLDGDAASIGRWVDALWWQSVSDDAQARRDGFGLCVVGADPELAGDKE